MKWRGPTSGGQRQTPPCSQIGRPRPTHMVYAIVVRRVSFWNWAGTHHLRK